MYVIINNNGKQYKVEKGTIINIDNINKKIGEKIEFDVVLYVDDNNIVTTNCENKYKVIGSIIDHKLNKKIIVFKYKNKKNERKKQGFRQQYTCVKIEDIQLV